VDGFSDNCVVLYIQENVRLIYMEFSGFHTPEYKGIDWKDYEGQPEVIQKEIQKRQSYRADLQYALEGFSTSPPPPSSQPRGFTTTPFITIPDIDSVEKNITTIQNLQQSNALLGKELINKYGDLSNNVIGLTDKMKYLYDNNKKYHYWGKDDPNVIIRPEESTDIRWALQKDVTEMKLYQNSIYISTVIACATLLIAAITISKP